MTNDTNITNDKDINANISHDDHFNDSIVNEVILLPNDVLNIKHIAELLKCSVCLMCENLLCK